MFLLFRSSDASASGSIEAETRSDRTTELHVLIVKQNNKCNVKIWTEALKVQRQVLGKSEDLMDTRSCTSVKTLLAKFWWRLKLNIIEDLMCNISSPSVFTQLWFTQAPSARRLWSRRRHYGKRDLKRLLPFIFMECIIRRSTYQSVFMINGLIIIKGSIKSHSTHLFSIGKGNIKYWIIKLFNELNQFWKRKSSPTERNIFSNI